ncbi:MAG: PilZ domain-containing protein [Planctomycetes bacterium]|nr:PilZ domain-containing protein [Planctomycetota bacterium]
MAKSSERRRHRRFDVVCRLRLEAPDGPEVRTRTLNVSDGGAYFLSAQRLEVGREVRVRLTVPRDTANTFFLEQFAAQAHVIRCDRPAQGQKVRGVALKFEKLLVLDLM